jgi:hypothetical protein
MSTLPLAMCNDHRLRNKSILFLQDEKHVVAECDICRAPQLHVRRENRVVSCLTCGTNRFDPANKMEAAMCA